MDKFNRFSKIPRTQRAVGVVKTAPVFLRPILKAWVTKPEEWKAIKMSGDRVGYVRASDLQLV